MNYADRIAVPFVAFLGEDEVAGGVVSLKDMTSGEQEQVSLSAASRWLMDKVCVLNQGAPIKG